MDDQRVRELLQWSQAEGLPLPLPPERIIEIEDQGHCIDLATGEIVYEVADLIFPLSAVGEATIHLIEVEGVSADEF